MSGWMGECGNRGLSLRRECMHIKKEERRRKKLKRGHINLNSWEPLWGIGRGEWGQQEEGTST
jgi:hypothetical protein